MTEVMDFALEFSYKWNTLKYSTNMIGGLLAAIVFYFISKNISRIVSYYKNLKEMFLR